MNDLTNTNRRCGRNAVAALIIVMALGTQCHKADNQSPPVTLSNLERVDAAAILVDLETTDPLEQMAQRDPLAFLKHCRENYGKSVDDYICTFSKQELVEGDVSSEQIMRVKYRTEPLSINMKWVLNAGDAAHVTYIKGRWRSKKGIDQAWCKPAGAIASLFISKIKIPIRGRMAESASRRTIDQFGFLATLDLIIKYCDKSAEADLLDLRYVGSSTFGGRPTYLFERHLPYDGDEGHYPDRLLRFHIDKAFLLPSSCDAYADDAGEQILGRYSLTDVQFNVGYTDQDFGPDTLGS